MPPRTTTALAAVATAAPLAIGAGSVLGLLGPASPVASRLSAASVSIAALRSPSVAASPAARALTAPALATKVAAVARPSGLLARTSVSVAALVRKVLLSPAFTLRSDAANRRRAYLEAVATDVGILPTTGRGLADVIAWLEVGNRRTPNDPWGPPPWNLVRDRVKEGCDHLAARSDDHPPDFDANDLVRLLYLYPGTVLATPTVGPRVATVTTAAAPSAPVAPPKGPYHLPRDVDAQIRTALKNWKFWIDEGGPDDMVYWSENHQILFATAEYLAGQLMPNDWFANGRMRGVDHKVKARPRVLRWLDDRLEFGFSEWNSPGYYEEDFKALFNLVDFCDDPIIVRRAAMVLDLMVFDLARFTHKGSFGVTSGRCYEKMGGDGSKWKSNGWRQSVGEIIEILFGTRGRFEHAGAVSALCYGTSKYEVPTVLLAIGKDQPDHFVDRSRVSIDFDEAARWGIGFNGLDDCMFWWSRGAYMAKQNVANTRAVVKNYGVTRLHNDIKDTLGFAFGAFMSASDSALRAAADAASPITEGMCLTKANLYTYRNKDVMLSSVQDYRRGQIGPQQHPWQATLGMYAIAFTTLPGKRESDGPGYWTGNAAMPSIVQHENALIAAYDAPLITQVKEGLHRTHAFFPKDQFDEFDRRRGSNLQGAWGVTSDGTWIFGRKGDGYIGIYSNEGFDNGPVDWVAAGSWKNVFICQVGNKAEFGSFQAFKDRVSSARIYVHYPRLFDSSPIYVGYDIPGKGRLELHYGGTPRLNGAPMPVHDFPRFENPYTSVGWGVPQLAIRHAGFQLVHERDTFDRRNPRTDVRKGDGVR